MTSNLKCKLNVYIDNRKYLFNYKNRCNLFLLYLSYENIFIFNEPLIIF